MCEDADLPSTIDYNKCDLKFYRQVFNENSTCYFTIHYLFFSKMGSEEKNNAAGSNLVYIAILTPNICTC